MEHYLEQIKPNVGNAWRTDELFLKIKGNTKYLYALMDDETRFWIAQQVADTKYTANINPLFKQGKVVTGKRLNTLISDGAPNFNDSFNKEFYTNINPKTRHMKHIRLQGDHNNNKRESLNGGSRQRENHGWFKEGRYAYYFRIQDISQLCQTTYGTERSNTCRTMRNQG